MKLVLVSFMFTWDQVDPVWIRSALWYQIGPLIKAIPYGTILFKFEPVLCKLRLYPYHSGSDPKQI